MRLKELYYRLKYRPAKGKDGATAIAVFSSGKKNLSSPEPKEPIFPCGKSNREVLDHIAGRYELKPLVLSETALRIHKTNFILNHCPQVLKTPAVTLSKNPSRKEMLAFSENSEKRFSEAMNYPPEQLGLEWEGYTFLCELAGEVSLPVEVICENASDRLSLSAAAVNLSLTEEQQHALRGVLDEIILYKGITQADIDNQTAAFHTYIAAKYFLQPEA